MKSHLHTFAIAALACLAGLYAEAHSGGLDANGGHYDRKTGYYHTHSLNPRPNHGGTAFESRPAHESTIYRRIQIYFQAANFGVVVYPGGQNKRDVSGSQRERVLMRDGYRCVICGSTRQLEIDHRRALMNGGDNSLSNLATLCDECHKIKTRMDIKLHNRN